MKRRKREGGPASQKHRNESPNKSYLFLGKERSPVKQRVEEKEITDSKASMAEWKKVGTAETKVVQGIAKATKSELEL